MGLFRDSRDRRDLSLKVCWTLAVWLMTQQLRCDVNEADEAEQRRLERHPEFGHAGQCLSELGWRRTVNTCPMACQWRLRRLLLAVLLEQRCHTLKCYRIGSHQRRALQCTTDSHHRSSITVCINCWG